VYVCEAVRVRVLCGPGARCIGIVGGCEKFGASCSSLRCECTFPEIFTIKTNISTILPLRGNFV
jgi:hypothetical protein